MLSEKSSEKIAEKSNNNNNKTESNDNDRAPNRKRKSKTISQISLIDDPNTPTEEVITALSNGLYLHKVRSFDKFYYRKFYVDLHNMRIHYTPSVKTYFLKNVPYYDISDLQEIRKGWDDQRFNVIQSKFFRKQASIKVKNLPDLKQDNCFSLVFESNIDTLDLIASNKVTRDLWIKGLNYLSAICKNALKENEYEYWIKQEFRKADTNKNGSLSFHEVLSLLNKLNMPLDRKHAKALFTMNVRKRRFNRREELLNPDEFLRFYQLILSRPELDILFRKYSIINSTIMGTEELLYFLKEEQKVPKVTLTDCKLYINRYEPKETQVPDYLSIKGFTKILLSIDFDIFNRNHRIICEDMTQPLSHYYIASSHNTYLLRDQLFGESSVKGYMKALLMSCRCVEIDVWDGDNNEPIVFHGHTLTSKIYLKDVLETIKDNAFKKSQYPVILSIENHCSVEQQKKMAQLFVEIFGDYLYQTPISDDETDLPSPDKLVRKILIKGKKVSKEFLNKTDSNVSNNTSIKDDSSSEFEESFESHNEVGFQRSDGNNSSSKKPTKKEKLAQEFSDLVNYCESRKFVSFSDCFKNWEFYQMASFKETKSEVLAQSNGSEYAKHNKRNLSRVYPKGLRTDSSNYNPIPHWNVGCQLVALNYQTWSKPMYFNEALFSLNGKCGYVLKPELLRRGLQYGHSGRNSIPSAPTNNPKKLKIVIISGQHIPKPKQADVGDIVDPYVKIKIYGHPADKATAKTKYIKNNGFNPIWNEEHQFLIRIPELAFIYFVVKDNSTTGKHFKLGQSILSFRAITEGYRHVRLNDECNQPIMPATLFVHISIVDIKTQVGDVKNNIN